MTERDKIILEVARQMDEKDLISTISDYKSINGLFIKFIDTLHSEKMECPIWQPHLSTHLLKFSLLNSSLIKEFEGISFNNPINNTEKKPIIYLLFICFQELQLKHFC